VGFRPSVEPQRCGKALYLGGVRAKANDRLSGFLDSASELLKSLTRLAGAPWRQMRFPMF
jgi:hypothetical protein